MKIENIKELKESKNWVGIGSMMDFRIALFDIHFDYSMANLKNKKAFLRLSHINESLTDKILEPKRFYLTKTGLIEILEKSSTDLISRKNTTSTALEIAKYISDQPQSSNITTEDSKIIAKFLNKYADEVWNKNSGENFEDFYNRNSKGLENPTYKTLISNALIEFNKVYEEESIKSIIQNYKNDILSAFDSIAAKEKPSKQFATSFAR